MFTEYIYSSNISDVVVLSDDVTESDIKHFKNIANRFYEKQYYIENIYKNGIDEALWIWYATSYLQVYVRLYTIIRRSESVGHSILETFRQ